MSLRHLALSCVCVLALTACGGARLVRNAEPPQAAQALVVASDARLAATLDFVIVRNGPGAWAKNAYWDEYLLRVKPVGEAAVTITDVVVVDSLGTGQHPAANRKALVRGSKDVARRYRHTGLKVRAGMGGMAIVATGVGAGLTAGGVAAAGGGLMAPVAGAAAFMAVVPGFAVAGIVRGINNRRVDGEIRKRQSRLPLQAVAGDETALDLFFPLAPSPQRIEIHYRDAAGAAHRLDIDTRPVLAGLHLAPSGAAGAP